MSAALGAPIGRRSFLRLAAVAGGGLVLGHYIRPEGMAEIAKPGAERVDGLFIPNAFIRIAPDGAVTVYGRCRGARGRLEGRDRPDGAA
jgi:CO/xanthine dehydrogenase Mo-binding subunit